MKTQWSVGFILAAAVGYTTLVVAQSGSMPLATQPLVMTGAIPLPNVQGRIVILMDPVAMYILEASKVEPSSA